ncbi:MAG: PadR family transcriptional regulator [Woeseiaceae bacterium]|nr:PadR family transcriptional regulator [Woeseiaceae bacterium]
MDVKTVCLGMLTDGEASGYDLKKTFESSFGHFFLAGFGSIYPALASLAKQGLVSCREVPQEGKPDRKVYSITAKGRQRLLEELDDPAPTHKVRSEFLVTMCFAHLMAPEQVQIVLDSRIADTEQYLKMFDEIEFGEEEYPAGVRFTIGFGRAMVQAMKQYVEQNRHMFDEESEPASREATG